MNVLNILKPLRFAGRIAGWAVALVFVGACSLTYNVAGEFENGGQFFYGTVDVSLGDTGSINIASADGTVVCTGTSNITVRPSGFTRIGGQGNASAKCNDGRTFKVDFIQTGESGGHGRGIDNKGGIVKLFFDRSKTAAKSRIKIERLNAIIK